MTRDEVMKLSDDELRVKAAEILGFRWFKNANGRRFMGMPDEGGCIAAESTVAVALDALRLVPDYPRDIAAAWELVLYAKKLDDATWAGRTLAIAEWFSRQSSADEWADDPSWELKEVLFNRISPRELTRAFVLAMSNEAH